MDKDKKSAEVVEEQKPKRKTALIKHRTPKTPEKETAVEKKKVVVVKKKVDFTQKKIRVVFKWRIWKIVYYSFEIFQAFNFSLL